MKTTTVQVEDEVLDRVDGLARTLNRSRSWVINEALDRFLDYEEWFIQEVQNGLEEAERGELASHEEAVARFRKWGAHAG